MSLENYGNYQLVKKLAMGGMAQIYLARRKGADASGELVVVKRILPHLAENLEFVRMFLDEARIAARLAHPNIVQIHDLGAQDDSFFLAMEYIHGEDLRRMCKRANIQGTPLPVPLACRIISDACAGLDYAHKKTDPSGKPLDIVHRDVSPQNILVSFTGGVKVVDFGIAKAADQATVTRSGVLKGKYSYMSPEQAAGQRVDCRSDVFALGVVLYEMLTNTRLFKRSTDMQTLSAVAECNVTPPSQVSPRVPPELDAIIMKALAKEPATRYAEALQLQAALEQYLAEHKYAASPADLAAFMRQVYADRLAREARAGTVEVDEEPPLTGQRTAVEGHRRPSLTPSTPASKEVTRAERGEVAPVAAKEVTRPDRGELVPALPFEPVEVTDRTHRPSRPLKAVESRKEDSSDRTRPVLRPTGQRPPIDPRFQEMDTRPVMRADLDKLNGNDDEHDQPTLFEPATSSLLEAGAQTEMTVLPSRVVRKRRWSALIAVIAGTVSAAAVALGLWLYLKPPPAPPPVLASVRLETVPPGAKVLFEGKVLAGVTPLLLPPVAAGSYPVTLTREGYQELRSTVEIPASGAVTLEPLRLEQVPAPPPETPVAPPVAVKDPPQPVVPAPAPAEVQPPVVAVPVRQPRVEPPPKPAPEAPRAMVRFAVTPWAEVSCGGRNLGTTPFEAVALPVGVYQCRFHNPDLNRTLTQRVEVKATGMNKVVVKF